MNTTTQYVTIVTLCVAAILAYSNYRCSSRSRYFRDPLLTKLGVWDLDGWSLTHVLFYVLLGYLFPTQFVPLMAAGVLWELTESHIMTRLSARGKCAEMESSSWWFGRLSDIPMNALGFYLGRCLLRARRACVNDDVVRRGGVPRA